VSVGMIDHMPGSNPSVDTARERSVSFAPHHGSPGHESGGQWDAGAVGPGRSASVGTAPQGAASDVVNRYPIQLAKVQRPALRDETLSRDRLLDWLAAKIHDRVILVLADAGYGKTTLLADFAGRTRLRTLWYRLEDDDRDWIAFLNHLVAAGREHDPGFAPTTSAMLADMSVGTPTRDAAIDVFLRELPSIAEHGAVLILDDFHLVDDSADVRLIARLLVTRAPERMSIIIASRRQPAIPLAKLRASGEVAELGTDDLRFDATETGRLFTETYGRALEPDVLADVVARTEGWAASLQLVQAALRDRTPAEIRRFVRSLSGADQELYDYLAEEVVGDLPDDLQQFLMRTSILQTVRPELAGVVGDLDAAETARLTGVAERLTLLSRPSRASAAAQRYHPLVREFLEARLRLSAGDEAVAALHRRVAAAASRIDWRVAAHHYREAGDLDSVASVVTAAIPEIMGSGQYVAASELIDFLPSGLKSPGLDLVLSRVEMQRGSFESALAMSTAALAETTEGSQERDHALLNLVTMHIHEGRAEQALHFADELRLSTSSDLMREIAESVSLMIATGSAGNLGVLARRLMLFADSLRERFPHYYGVTMLNMAIVATLQDKPGLAVEYADNAIESLEETSSRIELSTALMAKAIGHAMLGQFDQAEPCSARASTFGQVEAILERADIADTFESPESARLLLESADSSPSLNENDRVALIMQSARFLSRRGFHDEAVAQISEVDASVDRSIIGLMTALTVTSAYVAVAAQTSNAKALVSDALRASSKQGAQFWRHIAELLLASTADADDFSATVSSIGGTSPWCVTFVADLIGRRLDDLNDVALRVVSASASLHPGRWRFVLRGLLDGAESGHGLVAARILEGIGDRADIRRLRGFARRNRRLTGASLLGRDLAKRLADKVYVEDQSRVSIEVGQRHIPGSSIRRKVLALLCFLLTKPDLTSTRDQVLEALWPDLDPLDAVNSLNQTVYFLRRVLEEEYIDDLSPGYLHHDSDLIWLARDLVTSRSNECRALIKALPPSPTPDQVRVLADHYTGRFALDFEYEEWAAPYRDWLHASFLEVVERAVASDLETGHFERGIKVARRVLDVDPTAEQVEVTLLRLYRASGAHSAAAEQYGHYAGVLRDQLGLDPPPLDAL
jgi:ATP/maltotriose-dependent transcriptional regulator MalT/DNA-binding SARP family transcriptional activator